MRRSALIIGAALLAACGAGDERRSDPAAEGGTLVYSAWPDASSPDLFLVRADGSGKRDLTPGRRFAEVDPDWSPDGRRIVFAKASTTSEPVLNELFTIRADGSGEIRLTSTRNIDEWAPKWSPDGQTIAFVASSDDFGEDIYTMNADGGGSTRLTSFGTAGSPSWSPDGRRITFAAYASGGSRIFVMDADGSNRRMLTGGHWDFSPAWSPDGDLIAFQRITRGQDRANAENFRDSRILVVSPERASLSPERGAPTLVRDLADGGETLPAWSPDGERLAFVARRGQWDREQEDIRLYVAYADGGRTQLVTRLEWGRVAPVWQPG